MKRMRVVPNTLDDRMGGSLLIDESATRQGGERPEPVRRARKRYRVTKPYGPYVRGQYIEPTGVMRDVLLARGLIERVEDD